VILRQLLIVTAVSCLFAWPSLLAHAAGVPQLNVAPMCHGISDQGADPLQAGDPNVSFKQCMDSETVDKATLEKEWGQFSTNDKQHCTNEARMGGLPSYTDLLTCLEMARDVDKDRAEQRKDR
jgi:hypothetical protein